LWEADKLVYNKNTRIILNQNWKPV